MSTETLRAPHETPLRHLSTAHAAAVVAIVALLLAVIIAYRQSLLEVVRTWGESESYAHGWLILPIALWLAWRKRAVLAALPLGPSPAGLAAIAGAVLLWLFGGIANALVVQGVAIITLPAAIVWTVCGPAWARALAFPCAYLVFAIPFGEPLVAPLMEWTASATVAMLNATGIPVYRDGMLFSTSVGDFEVARACSGIRYLTASAAVGVLCGYLLLRTTTRRWVFAALAVVLPVLANAVRAYGIVLLAHATDMRLAVGVDHFVYGWVFFGLVMAFLFWIGLRMQRGERAPAETALPRQPVAQPTRARIGLFAAGGLLLVLAGPLLSAALEERLTTAAIGPRGLPPAAQSWNGPLESRSVWRPDFAGEPRIAQADYENAAGERITVTLVHYPVEEQGAELVGDVNALADETRWRFVAAGSRDVGGVKLRSSRFRAMHARSELTLWWLYAIEGATFVWPTGVKLAGALERLRAPPRAPVLVVLSYESPVAEGAGEAMQGFAAAHLEALLVCASGIAPRPADAAAACSPSHAASAP
jgi:exosortase A